MIKIKDKSAKGIAFEKERNKFRHQIRDLESLVKTKDIVIKNLEDIVTKKEEQISLLNDWVERLLEYSEMSKEDMRKIMEKDKEISEATKRFNSIFNAFGWKEKI